MFLCFLLLCVEHPSMVKGAKCIKQEKINYHMSEININKFQSPGLLHKKHMAKTSC